MMSQTLSDPYTLKPIEGSELSEYVINLLRKQNIHTVLQFLAVEDNKLFKITNIAEPKITLLKQKLRRAHGPQVVDALNYCSPCWKTKYTTGISSLDSLLGDEFRTGRIYEVCGTSGVGKSLLCQTIMLNIAHNYNVETLYIDTKRDFFGIRINRMLNERMLSKDAIGRIMQNIKVERCYNFRTLLNILDELLEHLRRNAVAFKVVVIDSIPALYYMFHDENESTKGKTLLTKCANILKQIAKEHQLIVICVNLMVRNILEEDFTSIMDEEDATHVTESQQPVGQLESQTLKPSLGKCWDGVPTIRLVMEDPFYENITNMSTIKTNGNHNTTKNVIQDQRIVRVVKSCFSPTGQECCVNVDASGIH